MLLEESLLSSVGVRWCPSDAPPLKQPRQSICWNCSLRVESEWCCASLCMLPRLLVCSQVGHTGLSHSYSIVRRAKGRGSEQASSRQAGPTCLCLFSPKHKKTPTVHGKAQDRKSLLLLLMQRWNCLHSREIPTPIGSYSPSSPYDCNTLQHCSVTLEDEICLPSLSGPK